MVEIRSDENGESREHSSLTLMHFCSLSLPFIISQVTEFFTVTCSFDISSPLQFVTADDRFFAKVSNFKVSQDCIRSSKL